MPMERREWGDEPPYHMPVFVLTHHPRAPLRMAGLRAGLIDELHLAIRPVLLGSGEHLLHDIDMRGLRYECAKHVAGERVTHVFLRKRA